MLITLTHINNNLIIRNEILDSLGKQAKSDLNSTSQSKQIILQEINKVKENNIRKNNKIVY